MSTSGKTMRKRGTLPHGRTLERCAWVRCAPTLDPSLLHTWNNGRNSESFSKGIWEPIKIVFQLSYKFEIVSKEEEKVGGGKLEKHKRYQNYMSKCNALNNL